MPRIGRRYYFLIIDSTLYEPIIAKLLSGVQNREPEVCSCEKNGHRGGLRHRSALDSGLRGDLQHHAKTSRTVWTSNVEAARRSAVHDLPVRNDVDARAGWHASYRRSSSRFHIGQTG